MSEYIKFIEGDATSATMANPEWQKFIRLLKSDTAPSEEGWYPVEKEQDKLTPSDDQDLAYTYSVESGVAHKTYFLVPKGTRYHASNNPVKRILEAMSASEWTVESGDTEIHIAWDEGQNRGWYPYVSDPSIPYGGYKGDANSTELSWENGVDAGCDITATRNEFMRVPASAVSGTLPASAIPSLNADKITSGTLGHDRLPALQESDIGGLTNDLSSKANADDMSVIDGTGDNIDKATIKLKGSGKTATKATVLKTHSYPFVTASVTNNVLTLRNGKIQTPASVASSLTIAAPSANSDGAGRDMVLVLNLVGKASFTLNWASGYFYPRTDNATDLKCTPGKVNVYYIGEYMKDRFLVSHWVEDTYGTGGA